MLTALIGGFSLANAEVSLAHSFNDRATAEQLLDGCSKTEARSSCEPVEAKWKLHDAGYEARLAASEGMLGLGCGMMAVAGFMRRRENGLD